MSDALSRSDRAGIVSEPSSQTNRIRPMERSDIPAVVRVHLSSFQGFFLSSLGERFLVVLYDRVLQLPDSIGFIAENASSSVVGFVIGVTSQAGLRRQLLVRYWPAFVRVSIGPALRHPGIVPRLLRMLRRPGEAQQAVADCLLVSIAVLPAIQGQHVGADLTNAFLRAAHDRGAAAVTLTTDRDRNDYANWFYQRMGFRLARSYVTAENRGMNEYSIDVSAGPSHREVN